MSAPSDQQQPQSGGARERRAHVAQAPERETRAPLLHIGNVLQVDVEGAPAKLGLQVTVICSSNDETLEQRFLGRTGTVCGLLYDAQEQYPMDPMVLVRVSGLGEDLFFPEELGLEAPALPRVARLRQRR